MSKLTDAQIAILREKYEKIDRIDPCCATWQSVQTEVQTMPVELRCQIAGAGIRWLSRLCEQTQQGLHRP